MTRVSVAVVIPTNNRPAGLMRALRSVYAQTVLPEEIIVVDDASVSPVSEAVFAECPNGPRTILSRHDEPRGAQVSRNFGMRTATTRYVAFLDDDDEFAPEKVRMLSSEAKSGAEVLYHAATMVYDDENFSYVSSPSRSITMRELLIRNLIGGTSMVCVAREPFLQIGGFDERMPALQDYEAWLRCAKNGFRLHYIDVPLTSYHHATLSGSISKSLDKFDRAVELLQTTYHADYCTLSFRERKEREVRIVQMRSHRLLLNRQRWRAFKYSLSAMLELRSMNAALGMVPALIGMRRAMQLRRLLAR